MSPIEHEPDWLSRALDAVTGRETSGAPPTAAEREYAETLRLSRRAVIEAPGCPTVALRRAQGLFRERGTARVLRLVFDSWRETAPALRGPGRVRTLRYEDLESALDVRVTRTPSGSVHLQFAAEPAREGLTARLEVTGSKRDRRISLDDAGAGQVRLAKAPPSIAIRVHDGEHELMRAVDVPLE